MVWYGLEGKIRNKVLVIIVLLEIIGYAGIRKNPTVRIINPKVTISTERAKEIVFSHAKADRKTSRIAKLIISRDDGIYLYEIIFFTQEKKYEYKVDANSGKVLNAVESIRNEQHRTNPGRGFFFGLF